MNKIIRRIKKSKKKYLKKGGQNNNGPYTPVRKKARMNLNNKIPNTPRTPNTPSTPRTPRTPSTPTTPRTPSTARTPRTLKGKRNSNNNNFNNNRITFSKKNMNRNNKNNPKKLSELINEDGTLTIYRAGSKGSEKIRDGISFYGISKFGIKSYTNFIRPKFHSFQLTSDEVNKLVDLSEKKHFSKIIDYYKKTNTNKKKILSTTLHFENEINNNSELIRYSDELDDDLKMAKILKEIFKGKKGSYTPPGNGLSHGEIIIWDKLINERLMGVDINNLNN